MKVVVNIARVLAGLLFIFSGLVKAIDPRGLAYKMEEFFEAWSNAGFMKGMMESLGHYSLSFSMIMITLEVVVGVALLIGWQKRLTTFILLLLMIFFTFLTGYVLFSGKIRACGCFGDCIPLTPMQTFTKDIILLIFALLLLIKNNLITPIAKPFFSFLYILIATLLTLALQFYVLKHLPIADCLPYKKGNDILKLRQMPANAIQDKFDISFVYEKNGEKKEFKKDFPDSTWTFVERKQTLVEKGSNNVPLINDFSLTDSDDNNATDSILSNPDYYYMVFIKEVPDNTDKWLADFKKISNDAAVKIRKLYVITAQRSVVERFLLKNAISVDKVLSCDATAIKTAARTNPTLYEMKGSVVQNKWGWADFGQVLNR